MNYSAAKHQFFCFVFHFEKRYDILYSKYENKKTE